MGTQSDRAARPKALVVSFFSSENLGDLLISDAIARMTARYAEVVRVNYGPHPELMTDLDDLEPRTELPLSRAGSTVRDLTHAVAFAIGGDGLVDRLRPGRRGGDRAKRELSLTVDVLVRQSDVLVIGGGNMLFDINRRSTSWEFFDIYVEAAKRHGRPVFGVSIGAGPFATTHQRDRAAAAAARCDALTVRDTGSLRVLEQGAPGLSATVVPDPVFALPRMLTPRSTSGAVAVNPMDLRLAGASASSARAALQGYRALVEQSSRASGGPVAIFSTDMQDYPFLQEIHSGLEPGVSKVYPITGVRALMRLYQDTSVVVASRMHSMITAFTQGIPVVGVAWQPKVRGFFETVSDVDSCFSVQDLMSHQSPIACRVREKLNSLDAEANRVESRLLEVRSRLAINDAILSRITA